MSVPALRFKDEAGQDFPDWKAKTISELAIKVIDGDRGQNYPNGNDFSDNGYCLFLNAKNVTKSGFAFDELSFITKDKDEQLRKGKLSKNDLIITTRGSVGNIAHFDSEVKYVNMRINSGMVILRNESTDISPNYLYQYFYSPIFTKSVQKIAFGSAQPQLTVLEIKKFIVGLPLIKEQTKIANFLTAVNEKITQLTQKHELLTQYKKGVMQQIFSHSKARSDCTVTYPRGISQELRFKDEAGQDFPEWEESKLGEISSFFSGGTPLTTKSDFYGGEIPFIKSGEISDNKTAQFISASGLKNSSAKMVLKGDLLYALYGATSGEVAVSKIEGAINQAVLCIRSKLDTYFLLSYFLFEKQNILQTYLQGGQGNLSAEIIKSLIVPIPSKNEQTKIANFLTAIDEKITATQTQLQAVKQYKQGLLQQMFV
ncbi:MAG: restriction endonuclease subunit S [Betaproteobacteria bacterium]